MLLLETLTAKAREVGWASGKAAIRQIQREAERLGWTTIPNRRGSEPATVLRPTTQADASPASLSAVYGLDDQPLHTDGAHLRTTPDVVILHCTVPSATSTRAWKFAGEGAPWNALRHGMFIVRNYDESFFAPALTGRVFRFDPACMSACDDRAFEVLDFFAQRLDESAEHRWIEEDTVLVLDNHSTLHARSKVVSDDLGRELTRLAFKTSAAQ